MKKTLISIALLIFAITLYAQSPTVTPEDLKAKQDSIKRVQAENQKLYKESFVITSSLIDSVMKKMESVITMKDIKEKTDNYKYYQNCEGFVNMLFDIWLENRKKKK